MNKATIIQLKKILGVSLIIVGVVGLILPILPGWWVVAIGFQILGLKFTINHRISSLWIWVKKKIRIQR